MRMILLLIVGLLGAAALSQAPEFTQQYRQNLNGRVEELSRSAQTIRADTGVSGPALEAELARAAAEGGYAGQAAMRERDLLRRRDRLAEHQARLEQAGPVLRLVELARAAEPEIAQATLTRFEPAAPITMEGAASAGVGFVTGWLLGAALLSGLAAFAPRRRRRA